MAYILAAIPFAMAPSLSDFLVNCRQGWATHSLTVRAFAACSEEGTWGGGPGLPLCTTSKVRAPSAPLYGYSG